MECSVKHFTFDKGKQNCELFFILDKYGKIFLFPYIMETGVSYSDVPKYRNHSVEWYNCAFFETPKTHLGQFQFIRMIHTVFRVDACTYKELDYSIL